MSIDSGTLIDSVHVTVQHLDRSVRFYEERIGCRVLRRDARSAALGVEGGEWLVLHEAPEATRVRGVTGLYHFAILLPTRPALAFALRHLMASGTRFQGFADHLVSEAIYLADPDGHGIELYRDRPRHEWPVHNGSLQMGSEPLDLQGLLADAGPASSEVGLPADTRLGHVHLHVAHLTDAERFYRDQLGFDLMQRYGDSASFLSAGGYHHHVAINTWAGVGAPAPPPGSIGLEHARIRVPNRDALEAVAGRLDQAGTPYDRAPDHLGVKDPSGNAWVIGT